MHRRTVRLFGAAVGFALILAACGQKPNVHVGLTFPGELTTGELTTGELPTGELPTDGPPIQFPTNDPRPGDPNPDPEIPPSEGPPGTPGPSGQPSAGKSTGPGDRTGITDTTITIGIHAPTTGAAPIESVVFEKGADLYWRALADAGKSVFGRTVKVVFRDDAYTPTTAVAVCKQMNENEKAFLLIGGAGTDQINACSQYAKPRGIPYLSPGVQEAGLSGRDNYFAVSMTYRAQMPLLISLLKKLNAGDVLDKYGSVGGGNGKIKIGHIRPNTPNFDDAEVALKAAVEAAGWEYESFKVVKEGNSNEAQTVASQLVQKGVDIAIPVTAPLFTTQLVLQADKNGYAPLWSGVAITNNVNAMIDTACKGQSPGIDGAVFFSPWPGWKQLVEGQDMAFSKAADKFAADVNNRKNGDLLYALWGIMRTIHEMFLKAGPDMSRESFINVGHNFNFSSGLFPSLSYSSGNPFGAKDVNVLLGQCDASSDDPDRAGPQWVTHPDYPGLRSSF